MDAIPLSQPVLLDGGTGAELLRRGMPAGACTERWIVEHPQVLVQLQKEYVAAAVRCSWPPPLGEPGPAGAFRSG